MDIDSEIRFVESKIRHYERSGSTPKFTRYYRHWRYSLLAWKLRSGDFGDFLVFEPGADDDEWAARIYYERGKERIMMLKVHRTEMETEKAGAVLAQLQGIGIPIGLRE